MKSLIAAFAALILLAPAAHADIATRKAVVIDYLSHSGGDAGTPVGVQVNEYEIFLKCNSFDRVWQQTGKAPAILGTELMFAIEYPPYEQFLTDGIISHTAEGGLVTMSWHWRNPLEVCIRGEAYECSKTAMSDADLGKMLTPGTPENALMNADIDAVAAVFKRLEAQGIVILWRPLHEMNGGWFWWGKKAQYPALWDAFYERLTVHNGVTNLIWVWSPDKASMDARPYLPVLHKPDIVGADIYAAEPDDKAFTAAAKAYRGLDSAPFALTEVGIAPSQSVVSEIRPAWILLWGGDFLNGDWAGTKPCKRCNSAGEIEALFARDQILTRDELPAALRATLSEGFTPDTRPRAACPAKLR